MVPIPEGVEKSEEEPEDDCDGLTDSDGGSAKSGSILGSKGFVYGFNGQDDGLRG